MTKRGARYQNRDQDSVVTATMLLEAVAEGHEDAVELAHRLVKSILDRDAVELALKVSAFLAEGSPFALVRAVELAELVSAHTHNKTQAK